jgi:hypothetical protein
MIFDIAKTEKLIDNLTALPMGHSLVFLCFPGLPYSWNTRIWKVDQ